jgi:hypothetical protein
MILSSFMCHEHNSQVLHTSLDLSLDSILDITTCEANAKMKFKPNYYLSLIIIDLTNQISLTVRPSKKLLICLFFIQSGKVQKERAREGSWKQLS